MHREQQPLYTIEKLLLREFESYTPDFTKRWAKFKLTPTEDYLYDIAFAITVLFNNTNIKVPMKSLVDEILKVYPEHSLRSRVAKENNMSGSALMDLLIREVCLRLGADITRKHHKEYNVYIVKQKVKICKNFVRTENRSLIKSQNL